MGFLERKKQPPAAVQTVAGMVRSAEGHPFGILDGYVPLRNGEISLYRAIREAVPIVDAAILKLIRLCGADTEDVLAAENETAHE